MTLRIGSRGSALALAQASIVARALGGDVEIVVIRTAGDVSERPIRELGDGSFVAAVEDAVRDGRVDLAVHSLKDVPTDERPGLVLAATPQREDPRDVLVTRDRAGLAALPRGAVVGTSSPRRVAFLRALRADVETREIRGNVDTRLRKVREGMYDGAILALAGLRRLSIDVSPEEVLSIAECPPAPGQGALALQCRADDRRTHDLAAVLDDRPTRLAVSAERALLRALGGSCDIPLGAWAHVEAGEIVLDAALATPDGVVRTTSRGRDADEVAARAAAALREVVRA